MVVKKRLQDATGKVKDSSLKSLKNNELGRVLTDTEIEAVKWYVEAYLSTSPAEYDGKVCHLIINGNVKNILKKYREFCEQGLTVAVDATRSVHRLKVVINEEILER